MLCPLRDRLFQPRRVVLEFLPQSMAFGHVAHEAGVEVALRPPHLAHRLWCCLSTSLTGVYLPFHLGIRAVAAPFGLKKRDDWRELVEPALRRDGERWLLHYDPRIAVPFRSITPEGAAAAEAAMWRCYDHIQCPTLLVRGENSDLLTRETLAEMKGRGPKPNSAEVTGVGHAPTFMLEHEIALVRDFLLG